MKKDNQTRHKLRMKTNLRININTIVSDSCYSHEFVD